MGKIFLSYRHDDSADVTGRLYDRLAGHFGAGRIFKDVDSLPLGIDFRLSLAAAVGRCEVLLAVMGRRWLDVADCYGQRRLDDERDFVRLEIEAALVRGIPVIPLLVQGASVPRGEQLPFPLQDLSYRHGMDVQADPHFHDDVDRLIRCLERLLRTTERARRPAPVERRVRISADAASSSVLTLPRPAVQVRNFCQDCACRLPSESADDACPRCGSASFSLHGAAKVSCDFCRCFHPSDSNFCHSCGAPA